ncbi:MAG TPA: gephyrin-like molybdotransferase Glp [Bacillota bacterium]
MVEIRKPISVDDAVQLVMEHRIVGEKETIPFVDCDDRRLAEPLIATHHVPSFDKSPYDGFAIRSVDTKSASKNNPVEFTVVEHIGAGQVPEVALSKQQATRIMTGAKIPDGADCVIMFENCQMYERDGKNFMSIEQSVSSGQNIIKEGSEVQKGTSLVERGTLINPGVKALLATFGYDQVVVSKKPVVGILATGTELLEVDEPLEEGKIRNSNAYMIASQVKRAGGDFKYYGQLADEKHSSYELIKKALEEVDFLITTGGVSVGDYDLMPEIYEMLQANILFNKIGMRPGSVTTVALLKDTFLFGLSGNPSACYVGFELFVRPIMQYYMFSQKPFLQRTTATLAEDFPKENPFTRFVRCYTTFENGKLFVHLAGKDKSNVVSSLAHTTCFMELRGGTGGCKAGSTVEVLLLNSENGQANFRE